MNRPGQLPSFDAWATSAEPALRKALLGAVGVAATDQALDAALRYAWERWDSVSAMTDWRGHLYRVGVAVAGRSEPMALPILDPSEVADVAPDFVSVLLGLPDQQRSALWLVHGCGWTVPEVAAALDLGTLKVGSILGVALGSIRRSVPATSSAGSVWPDPTTQIAAIAEAAVRQTDAVMWPTDEPNESSGMRWMVPTMLLAAVIVVAAVIGPRLSDPAPFATNQASQAESDSANTAEAGQTAQPTTGQLDDGGAEHAGSAIMTAPVPTAPAQVAQGFVGDVQIVGDRLIVVDSNEVWLSSDRAASWQRLAFPEGAVYDSYSSCFSSIDDRIIVSTAGSGSRKLFVEDRDLRSWNVVTVPAAPERANWYWGNRLCRPVEVNDAWVLATTERDGLRIASTRDGGVTFFQHQILFPPNWLSLGTDFGLGGFVNLFVDEEWLVAQLCISREGISCASQELRFHSSVIARGASTKISWDATDSEGQPLIVWNDTRFTYTNEIELFQFESAVWRTEIAEIWGYVEQDDLAVPYGTWASGPFDGPLSPLPGRPSLFPRDDGAVACVQEASECWIRDQDDLDWTRLDESPVVAWETLPLGTQVTFSELTADGRVLVVPFSSLR